MPDMNMTADEMIAELQRIAGTATLNLMDPEDEGYATTDELVHASGTHKSHVLRLLRQAKQAGRLRQRRVLRICGLNDYPSRIPGWRIVEATDGEAPEATG